MVNTALTAAGMWMLAIPGLGLLSLFVFICSFIPIAGCFISTAPIAFVALTEYGFLKVRARGLLAGIICRKRLPILCFIRKRLLYSDAICCASSADHGAGKAAV